MCQSFSFSNHFATGTSICLDHKATAVRPASQGGGIGE